MTQFNSTSRRSLLLTLGASSMVAACGGGSGGGYSSGSSGGSSSSSSSSSTSSASLPDPATAPALKTLFASNFKVGLVADDWISGDASISALVIKHASSMTAESVMKANPIGVSAGVYNFVPADKLVTFTQANGIALRGHALSWHQTTPSWFFDGDSTASNYKSIVRARLETYITDVVTHFKGKVYAWDVVNEVVSDDASQTYRNSQMYQVLGKDFIDYAFKAARAADPNVQLFINDFSTDDPAKRGRLMTVVDDLLARGIPVDGVGHQTHVNTSVNLTEVENALIAVESRGLINHVTEMDVSLYADPGSCYATPATGCLSEFTGNTLSLALQAQALKYRALFNLFIKHSSVKVVTMWGTSDAHSWLNTFPITRTNYPLLFDRTANPKSAFWAVADPTFVP